MTPAQPRVRLTATATRNIIAQADYYRTKSGKVLADHWRIAVKDTAASLKTMPHRGEPCRFASPSLIDIRRLEVKGFERFSFFYRVEPGTTLVLLVVHEARDVESLLRQTI